MEDEETNNHWKDEKWLAKGKMITQDEEEGEAIKTEEAPEQVSLDVFPETSDNRSEVVKPADAAWQERLSELMIPEKYIKFCKDACEIETIRTRTEMGLEFDLLCPCCARTEETMIHCLRQCPHAMEVWSTSSLRWRVAWISSSTFKEFLRAATRVLNNDKDLSLFVLICWFLWEARNDYVEHRIVPNPADILRNALLLLEDASRWVKDKILLPLIADMDECGPSEWEKPPKRWLKMNVEAYVSGPMMAMGAVVRDDNGRFLAAVSESRVCARDDLLLAQSVALIMALKWAENRAMIHHHKLIVGVTPWRLVTSLEHPAAATLLWPQLCKPLKYCRLLASRFPTLHYANVIRADNRLAYGLAGLAARQVCEGSWFAPEVPEWLLEAILADMPQ